MILKPDLRWLGHSLLLLLLMADNAYAQQAYLSPALEEAILNARISNEPIEVTLVLKQKTDLANLEKQFAESKVSVDFRAKKVIRELKKTARISQQPILDYFTVYNKVNPGSAADIKQYWLVNIISLQASPQLVSALSERDDIEYMELVSENTVALMAPMKGDPVATESLNGIEPGLAAINAPALWKLGYTGRGRLLLSVDTGVFPDHPAHGDRFLGYHFPLSQSWYGYDHYFPADKEGTHGTHTIGTVLGLEKSTNDTIGVAFNAYYIATDPIVTDLSKIKPMTEIIKGFEWALNPDGDTSTSSDIPDVINNSWGKPDPPDTAYCVSFVSDLFNALETAGIAFVFSAGNNGPQSATIRLPQFIATNEVNVFTAGSIDGNTAGFPISNFSSRGPTTCQATGSVLIKPEVVAPGQNVRSSVGHSGYDVFSGTSMAAPHVCGAVLLLKEAFPYLPGKEILLALYYTASDLGAPGEDNTYGRGIIDVWAAYQYLAQSYIPVPPKAAGYDLVLKELLNIPFNSYSCDTFYSPKLVVLNNGDSSIQNIVIQYAIDDSITFSETWNGILLPGGTDTIGTYSFSASSEGIHTLQVQTTLQPQKDEMDDYNNSRHVWFHVQTISTLDYHETFNIPDIYNSAWYLENPDDDVGWTINQTAGLGDSFSAYIPFGSYLPRAQQQDFIISPQLEMPDSGKLFLKFDMAYKTKFSAFKDSFFIEASSDCGSSFPFRLYSNGGAAMNTHLNSTTNPSDTGHWDHFEVDVSQLTGLGKVMLRLRGVNDNGGHLYIDNISLVTASPPVGIHNQQPETITLYPNPASNELFIKKASGIPGNLTLCLLSVSGQMIQNISWDASAGNTLLIDVSGLAEGVYVIACSHEEGKSQSLFVKAAK